MNKIQAQTRELEAESNGARNLLAAIVYRAFMDLNPKYSVREREWHENAKEYFYGDGEENKVCRHYLSLLGLPETWKPEL